MLLKQASTELVKAQIDKEGHREGGLEIFKNGAADIYTQYRRIATNRSEWRHFSTKFSQYQCTVLKCRPLRVERTNFFTIRILMVYVMETEFGWRR